MRHPRLASFVAVTTLASAMLACGGGDGSSDPVAPTPTYAKVGGFWSGSAGGVHFHLTFAEHDSVLSLDPLAPAGERTLIPLDSTGVRVLGSGNPVDLTSIAGVAHAKAVTVTLNFPTAQPLVFTGTLTDSATLSGEVHGAALASTPLVLGHRETQ